MQKKPLAASHSLPSAQRVKNWPAFCGRARSQKCPDTPSASSALAHSPKPWQSKCELHATWHVPATHACPWSDGHSALELHARLLGMLLGAPAPTLAWPALPAVLARPAVLPSGSAVWQSSRRHSLFEQPPKTRAPKLVSTPSSARRLAIWASASVETRPKTIRENAELLTGRSTGLPCTM